ncbi:hypothetical protein F5Y14DRAFT_456787 [Nemania sp. NC0429]|nr:hypothetical protein F5Y14DRAFT_456787 [Nemania sp. NC0429]
MPPGERNTRQTEGLDYGAAMAGENVEFAAESNTESPGTRDRALLDKLKDALKPGDARRFGAAENRDKDKDRTHDGRHGGIEEVMQPGHRDYEENTHPQPHPRRGSVLDELGERGYLREGVPARGNGPEETGAAGAGGRNHTRRPSILERMPFGLGQRLQDNARQHDESQDQMKKKEVGSGGGVGANEHHRDSTHMRTSDENRLPGSMYRSLRDDFSK